jgi:AcrR family transcriptional regulator
VAAAEGLLARSGPRSVSMDAAAAVAGAGKMSAYRHFASKEDLLAAALDRHDPHHVRWLTGSDGAAGDPAAGDPVGGDGVRGDEDSGDPVGRILAVFDRVEVAASSETFRGCPFVDAALARSETDERPAAIAGRHKEEVARVLAGLAARAGLADSEELGADLALVLDGAVVQAALVPDPGRRRRIVRRGRRVAQILLASAARS